MDCAGDLLPKAAGFWRAGGISAAFVTPPENGDDLDGGIVVDGEVLAQGVVNGVVGTLLAP